MQRVYVVQHHGQRESTNQTRCMDCLVANGAIQVAKYRDIMPDRIVRRKVDTFNDPIQLSPVTVYNLKARSSMVVYAEVN